MSALLLLPNNASLCSRCVNTIQLIHTQTAITHDMTFTFSASQAILHILVDSFSIYQPFSINWGTHDLNTIFTYLQSLVKSNEHQTLSDLILQLNYLKTYYKRIDSFFFIRRSENRRIKNAKKIELCAIQKNIHSSFPLPLQPWEKSINANII